MNDQNAPTRQVDEPPDFIDFFLGHNNGVVTLWPNPNGRFAVLASPVEGGRDHRCWAFSTPSVCDGVVSKAHLLVFHGNIHQLHELVDWMKSENITSSWSGCAGTGFVPFSNGRSKTIPPKKEGGEWSSDYEDRDHSNRYPSDPRMTIEAHLDVINGVTER